MGGARRWPVAKHGNLNIKLFTQKDYTMKYPQANYVVYIHQELDGTVRYVGSGEVSRAFSFSRNELHQEWLSTKLTDYSQHIKIVAENLTQGEARTFEMVVIKGLRDQTNLFNTVGNRGKNRKYSPHTSELIGKSQECTLCKETKDVSKFTKDNRKDSGYRSNCKKCVNDKAVNKYWKAKEK